MPKSMSGTFVHIVKHNGIRGPLQRPVEPPSSGKSPTPPHAQAPLATPPDRHGHPPRASSAASPGNAADVLNVRMQHDAALPAGQRRNYAHAGDGLVRMVREEGAASLFRGVWPNSARAAAMTASQLASYDVFKRTMLRLTPMQDNLATHFSASFLAGVVAATVTSPIDVIKTRVMSATGGDVGVVGVLREVYAKEGMRWMFKGWVPSFLRLGP
ncbi:hypothetical protein CHGG_10418 [Chaetomium globosum CBS 148.51]|uniref:Mitochondrial dicarboxylate carrier n=1 Tax=Chaetomium globosum (strain ATCC 6205 / CBS 148.51 / DSM 1962 / NBRC 6347 / NRRL 1970) TaxID=306901 RepID=Q2GNN6_CHAGB|nr:uncharacterized protein CHGG_10418 [Chaetomium globosum CBS 148.51]EAQ84014.1 hypothetical protein CHGG_10418 [Chaetomium globosum CBS 148.51]